MNKNEAVKKVKQLELELDFLKKDLNNQIEHWKGEFIRLKTAYKMSEKLIRELEQNQK